MPLSTVTVCQDDTMSTTYTVSIDKAMSSTVTVGTDDIMSTTDTVSTDEAMSSVLTVSTDEAMSSTVTVSSSETTGVLSNAHNINPDTNQGTIPTTDTVNLESIPSTSFPENISVIVDFMQFYIDNNVDVTNINGEITS